MPPSPIGIDAPAGSVTVLIWELPSNLTYCLHADGGGQQPVIDDNQPLHSLLEEQLAAVIDRLAKVGSSHRRGSYNVHSR